MKIKAINRMGNNGKCEFRGEKNNNLYYTQTTIEDKRGLTNIFDNNDQLIATVSYTYSNINQTSDIFLEINNKKLKFGLDSKNNVVCEDMNLRIDRGALDKSFKLYIDGKLVMSARTFTMVRDWLLSNYSVKIFDETQEVISICSCVLMFRMISLQAIESTRQYMGKFKLD